MVLIKKVMVPHSAGPQRKEDVQQRTRDGSTTVVWMSLVVGLALSVMSNPPKKSNNGSGVLLHGHLWFLAGPPKNRFG